MKLTKSLLKEIIKEELLKEAPGLGKTITDPMQHTVYQRRWQMESFVKDDLGRIIKYRKDSVAGKVAKQLQVALKHPIKLMIKLEQHMKQNPK